MARINLGIVVCGLLVACASDETQNGQAGGGNGGTGGIGGGAGGVEAPRIIASLAANGDESCALYEDGGVTCWGSFDEVRQLPIDDAVALSIGDDHGCALRTGGSISCWGRNEFAQLGLGTEDETQHPTPVEVPGLSGVVEVVAGGRFTLARTADGTVYGWGENQQGELALTGTGFRVYTPTPLPLSDVVQLAGGASHACSRHGNGTVSCWGRDKEGQLGLGTDAFVSPPGVLPLAAVSDIALGDSHSCAIAEGGATFCWGNNFNGKVGVNLSNSAVFPTPTLLPTVVGAVALDLGPWYACALLGDATAMCWGNLLSGTPVGPHVLPNVVLASDGAPLAPLVDAVTSYRACFLSGDRTTVHCYGYGACEGPDALIPCVMNL
jgi:hypothetical protein